MAKIFITGGISSGKSQFAENTALALYKSNIIADAGMSGGITGGTETNADNFSLLHFIATANTKIKTSANNNADAELNAEDNKQNKNEIDAAEDIKDGEMLLKIIRHKEKRNKVFVVHENFGDLTA